MNRSSRSSRRSVRRRNRRNAIAADSVGLLAAAVAGLVKFAAPLLILLKTGGTMLLSIAPTA